MSPIQANPVQRGVFLVSAAVQFFMLAFPPFVFHAPTSAVVSAGYSFILAPPEIRDGYHATVDVGVLALEIVVAWAITTLLCLAFSEKAQL